MDIPAVAVIPARGGSKGIPDKNLAPLAGRPLLAWTIDAARGAGSVSRVFVSTEDQRIAATAATFGAEVIPRPPEIATDTASSEAALLHALEWLERSGGQPPGILVFLQCTSPLTLPEDIDGTVHAMRSEGADCAFAATRFDHFVWRRDAMRGAVGVNHDSRVRLRRQDRELEYLEAGSVYAMHREGFLAARHRFFGRVAVYEMPAHRVLEIDTPADLARAEVMLQQMRRRAVQDALPGRIEALVLDFDGVLTDNRVLVQEDGSEAVLCHRGDGWGLARLRELGVPMLVLSVEANSVVAVRCRKLGLDYLQGVTEKLSALEAWMRERGISPAGTVYVGNDVPDVPCLRAVGCGVAVADAVAEARAAARLVLDQAGGRGAVRELCDLIRLSRQK